MATTSSRSNHDRERQALRREREHQLDVAFLFRVARYHMAKQYLPDEHGVRRKILRTSALPPPLDEVPVETIAELLDELGVYEELADQRARVIAKKLGLDRS